MTRRSPYAWLLLLVCSLPVLAEQPTTNPAGVVEPGAMVEVTVYDLLAPGVGTPLKLRVDAHGRVVLPFVDQVDIGGKTTDVAAQRIATALQQRSVIRNGVVTVAILERPDQATAQAGPIALGDTLQITVFNLTSANSTMVVYAQVGDDGTVVMPVAGPVRLVGMTESDALVTLRKHYLEKNVMAEGVFSILKLSSKQQ